MQNLSVTVEDRALGCLPYTLESQTLFANCNHQYTLSIFLSLCVSLQKNNEMKSKLIEASSFIILDHTSTLKYLWYCFHHYSCTCTCSWLDQVWCYSQPACIGTRLSGPNWLKVQSDVSNFRQSGWNIKDLTNKNFTATNLPRILKSWISWCS